MDHIGYIIIDGSHLFSAINEIYRIFPEYKGRKLNIGNLSNELIETWRSNITVHIRTIYYFKQNDSRMNSILIIPDPSIAGNKNHWLIKECGESLDAVPDEELQNISPQYRDHFARAEKGLDIKLACDALLIAANKQAGNIIFMLNDRDYIPLIEALQNLGANVYLSALHSSLHVQKGIAKIIDKFLTLDGSLNSIFEPISQEVRSKS